MKRPRTSLQSAQKLTDTNVVVVISFIFMSTLEIWFFGMSTFLYFVFSLRQEELKTQGKLRKDQENWEKSREVEKSLGKLRNLKLNWEISREIEKNPVSRHFSGRSVPPCAGRFCFNKGFCHFPVSRHFSGRSVPPCSGRFKSVWKREKRPNPLKIMIFFTGFGSFSCFQTLLKRESV